jgi:F-type H+-transporting ATPase subunit c
MTLGILACAAAACSFVGVAQGVWEARIAIKAIEMVGKNPEQYQKINSMMILGIALSETTGIYAIIVSVLIIFVLGGKV